jgi:hypothetical protein
MVHNAAWTPNANQDCQRAGQGQVQQSDQHGHRAEQALLDEPVEPFGDIRPDRSRPRRILAGLPMRAVGSCNPADQDRARRVRAGVDQKRQASSDDEEEAAETTTGSLVRDATNRGVAIVASPLPRAEVVLAAHSFANRPPSRAA